MSSLEKMLYIADHALQTIEVAQIQHVMRNEHDAMMIDAGYTDEARNTRDKIKELKERK